jgi:hypothetical protein
MADDQERAVVGRELVAHPARRVVRLQAPHGPDTHHRIARAPEQLRRLSRTQLAAVPDFVGMHTAARGVCGESSGGGTSGVGQRPQRIDFRADRLAMMNQKDHVEIDLYCGRQARDTSAGLFVAFILPSLRSAMSRYTFTSESVSEGHPDKVCDYISDSILDACLAQDRNSRVACETLCKSDTVVIAGEITTSATLDYDRIIRQAVREIGYTDTAEPFCDSTLRLVSLVTRQSSEIDQGVTAATSQSGDQGAGDQGIMFGYATDESPELMPLPLLLAHKLTKGLADDRKAGKVSWLRPDSKSQVSVLYENNEPREVTAVVVSTQHTPQADQKKIADYVREALGPRVLGEWWGPASRCS